MSDLYVIEGVDVDDADGRHWSRPIPREATIPEVVAWLREQGATEDECLRCDGKGYWDEPKPLPGYSPGPPPMTCPYCAGSGRVVVAPVDAALRVEGEEE